MTDSLNVRNTAIVVAGSVYFIALAITTQSASTIVQLFWYASIMFAAVVSLIVNIRYFRIPVMAFLGTIIGTGVINYYFIGSIELKSLFTLAILFIVTFLFINERFDHNAMLPIIIFTSLIILYRMMTNGVRGQIFISSSQNYVSVYLLYPTIIYYTLAEKRGKKYYLWPAILLWGLSLLAGGRGGIFATSALLGGIALITYRRKDRMVRAALIPILVALFGLLVINLNTIENKISSSMIWEVFRDRGMKSSRLELWKDYLHLTFSDIKYIIWGTDIRETLIWQRYLRNPHNSFINIHTNNGLILLIMVLGMTLRNFVHTLKRKRYIYIICFAVFLFRAFTDTIFWMTYGSVALFFMLFIYAYPEKPSVVNQDQPKLEDGVKSENE